MTDLFTQVSLCMNAKKTKAMVTKGRVNCIRQSTIVYVCRLTDQRQTYQERNTSLTNCPLCPAIVQRWSLPNHVSFCHDDTVLLAKQLETDGLVEDITPDRGIYSCDMSTAASACAKCPIPGCPAELTWRYGMC